MATKAACPSMGILYTELMTSAISRHGETYTEISIYGDSVDSHICHILITESDVIDPIYGESVARYGVLICLVSLASA